MGLRNMNLALSHWESCEQLALPCFYIMWLCFCLKTSNENTYSRFSGSSLPVGGTLYSLSWLHCSQLVGRVLVTAPPEPVSRIEYFLLTQSLPEITCFSCIFIMPLIGLMVLSINASGTWEARSWMKSVVFVCLIFEAFHTFLLIPFLFLCLTFLCFLDAL